MRRTHTALEVHALDLLSLGPQTTWELCKALDVDRHTAWVILTDLSKDGTVTVTRVGRGRGNGSGRPSNVYQLATAHEARETSKS